MAPAQFISFDPVVYANATFSKKNSWLGNILLGVSAEFIMAAVVICVTFISLLFCKNCWAH